MILAIDTATRWVGLGLHDGTAVVAELGWQAHNTQSQTVAPSIAALLERANLSAEMLRGIAIAIGPGSYTGLRIGLAVAKGLALAHHLPLIGVPTLDITAASVDRGRVTGQLMAVIEAGRTRITAVPYRWQRGFWVAEAEPQNTLWEELIASCEQPTTFTGEIRPEAMKMIRAAGKHIQVVNPASSVRRAVYLAELGWLRLKQQGKGDDPRTLAPLYGREPDGA